MAAIFFQMIPFINTIYAVKLGNQDLMLGFSLGFLLMEAMMTIVFGMNGAMETFVAQAHGAGQTALCGVYLNRAFVIN